MATQGTCTLKIISDGVVPANVNPNEVCELQVTLVGSDHDPVLLLADRRLSVAMLCAKLAEIFASALGPDERLRLTTVKGATLAPHWVVGDMMPNGARLRAHSQLVLTFEDSDLTRMPLVTATRTYAEQLQRALEVLWKQKKRVGSERLHTPLNSSPPIHYGCETSLKRAQCNLMKLAPRLHFG